jgi:hypothetical protein
MLKSLLSNPCVMGTNTQKEAMFNTTDNYCNEIRKIRSERHTLYSTLGPRIYSNFYNSTSTRISSNLKRTNEIETNKSSRKRTKWSTELSPDDCHAVTIPPPPSFSILNPNQSSTGASPHSNNSIRKSGCSSSGSSGSNSTINKDSSSISRKVQIAASSSLLFEFNQRAHHLCSVFRSKSGETKSTKQKREIALIMKDVLSLFAGVIGSGGQHNYFDNVCKKLALDTWSEESIHDLFKQLSALGLSQENTYILAKHALLPRVLALKRPASRTLVNMAVELLSLQPKAIINSTLVPVLFEKGCSSSSVELVSRVAKNLSVDHVVHFVGLLVDANNSNISGDIGGGGGGGSGGGGNSTKQNHNVLPTSDSILGLLKTMLSVKGVLLSEPRVFSQLTEWLNSCLLSNPKKYAKSMKLASVVHVFVTKQLSQQSQEVKTQQYHDCIARIEELVLKLNTFMTKSTLTALGKLK